MNSITRHEFRKRGFFGWVFLLLFFGFNIFMVFLTAFMIYSISEFPFGEENEKIGLAIGGAISFSLTLGFWASGAIILGILALVTRGSKTVVKEFEPKIEPHF